MDVNLKKKGFTKIDDSLWLIRFPVLWHQSKPTLDAEIIYNTENNTIKTMVYNAGTNVVYQHWYNRDYGKCALINIIQKNIDRKIKTLNL